MAAPATTDEFLDLVRKSGVSDERRLTDYLAKARTTGGIAADASRMAGFLVRDGLLTTFQAEQILQGKWRRFTIGKYKVLERIGSGGMGAVYLCEHKLMRRRVAVKVLPTAKAADPSSLERFYREARAVAALDHPNIVHAYDIDQDESLHFLVMEYVDGANLQDIVKISGPLDIERACHYVRQSAEGLAHAANKASLVHRDIKPGNILVDRTGLVKILDMGLARFFNDEDDILTKKFDENVLGTADYLAPEQAVDSHTVDIRADIYSLGATFYFMLAGRPPFSEGTVAQKLLWHQSRKPDPITKHRPDVPEELAAVIDRMMAKNPDERYQRPEEVAEALEPFTVNPIAPPPESEMPRLSLAATGGVAQPSAEDQTSVSLKQEPTRASGGSSAKQRSAKSHAETLVSGASPTPKPRVAPTPPMPPAPSSATKRAAATPPPASAKSAPPSPAPPPEPEPTPDEPEANADLPTDAPWSGFADEGAPAEFTPEEPEPQAKAQKPGQKPRPAAAPNERARRLTYLFGGAFAAATVLLLVGWFAIIAPMLRPPPPVERLPLDVTADSSKPGTFRLVRQALAKAKAGDVIRILDETHTESLDVDYTKIAEHSSEVTVQGAPGKTVVWRSANKNFPDRPIVSLKGAYNFKLANLTFDGTLDGDKRANRLIDVYMKSPGLTLENLRFQAFDQAALKIMNAAGDKARPIRVNGIEILALQGAAPQAGVLFDANPSVTPSVVDWVEFHDARVGSLKTPYKESRKGILGDNVVGVK